MRRALLLFAVASCGRFGFGDQSQISDGKRVDGSGDGPLVDGPPPLPFAPYWKSGTRIRARLFEVGDGSDPIFYGWRDTALDTDCVDSVASDGVERCMPNHAPADIFYGDAACTAPLAWTHGLCGHDSYGYFKAGVQYHAVPITTVFSGQAYELNGAACNPAASPASGQLWNTGAEVPATSFVPIHYSTRTIGAYDHILYDWRDGSEYDLGSLNFNQGSCDPTGGIVAGTTGCKPTSDPVLVPVYSDLGCSQRAYYDANDSSGVTEFITTDTSLCGVPFHVFQTLGQIAGATYWTLGPSGCTAQAIGVGSLWTAVAVDPYPHGTIAPSAPHGRIGYLQWTTSDGVSIPLAEWDFTLGRSCRPFIAADGVVRCLPRAPKITAADSDATCSSALSVAGNCYGVDPVDGVGYGSCDDGPWNVHTYAPIAASYVDEEATCTSLGPAYDASSNTGSVPASTFAPLTEVIE